MQANFLRSATRLRSVTDQQMRQLSGTDVRNLMPKSSPSTPLEPTSRQNASAAVFKMVRKIVEKGAPKLNDALKDLLSSSSAGAEHYGRIAHGLGMLRDADGNVIYLDAKDNPYVLVEDGQIVYVKVYQARVTPSGKNLDAKCTIDSPDGKQAILLVEPIPQWRSADPGSL